MLTIAIENSAIRIGPHFAVSFHRTLRIPDDGRDYPLPPGLGMFPVFRVADYQARCPVPWRDDDSAFIAMYQGEALWLGFHGPAWRSQAAKVAVGGMNALSGQVDGPSLSADPQDYIVCPDQPWLDGINSGRGHVRQFVAMPLGAGETIEAALSGREVRGGLQLTVFEPRPGRFPDQAPPANEAARDAGPGGPPRPMAAPVMGLGAGGRLAQKIYPDPYGIDTWDPERIGRVTVHILNSRQFTAVTGQPPPPSPVDAAVYAAHGLPWFKRYEEDRPDIAPVERLAAVKSIGERAGEADGPQATSPALTIVDAQVRIIGGKERQTGRDGKPPS
jgi:hypothetical protein